MTKEEMYKALDDYRDGKIDDAAMSRLYEQSFREKVFTDENEEYRFNDRRWAEMIMKA